MLEKLEEYIIPKTIPEAVRLLRTRPPGNAVAITGAIDLHWPRLQNARRVLDTSRLAASGRRASPSTAAPAPHATPPADGRAGVPSSASIGATAPRPRTGGPR